MLFFLAGKQCVDGRVQLGASLQEVEFEDEGVAQQRAAELLYERACSRGRSTWAGSAGGALAGASAPGYARRRGEAYL